MSDFFPGILSALPLFSYTFLLGTYFSNIFFLQYSFPDLAEGVDKAPHPPQAGVLQALQMRRLMILRSHQRGQLFPMVLPPAPSEIPTATR
jgi:hypothetical protein